MDSLATTTDPADTAQVAGYRPLTELVPPGWQSGFIEASDGMRLHYTRTGEDKPPVVLLHGIIGAGLMWLRTAHALEAEYDVLMPDLRGHGLSGRVTGGCTIAQMADDAAALIQSLRLERPAVVGHSLGAEVAGQFAAAHPSLVRAAVLVDPPLFPFPPPDHADGEMPPGLDPLIEAVAAMQTQSHPERLLTLLGIMPPDVTLSLWEEADFSSGVDAVAQFDVNVLRYRLGASLIDMPEAIARIDCPLLLLSSRGKAHAPGIGTFETHWRDGRHIHFPDSGHFIPNEQHGRFVAVVRDFLGK